MNKKDLENMLGMVDDKYLKEASPTKKRFFVLFNKSLFVKIAAVAACLVLLLNAVIFPALLGAMGGLRNELENKDAQIQDILNKLENEKNTPHTQKIYELNLGQMGGTTSKITLSTPQTAIPSEYVDLVDLIGANTGGSDSWQDMSGEIADAMDKNESLDGWLEDESGEWLPGMDATEGETSNGKYEETTDLQTNGVIEGDIIKRSTKYIYYLNGDILNVYSISGLASSLVGTVSLNRVISLISEKISLQSEDEEIKDRIVKDSYTKNAKEMYLSKDCKTVSVIVSDYFYVYGYEVPYVAIISVNVENPQDMYVSNVATLYGEYESSRVIDDEIFVFTKHKAKKAPLAIPQYSDGDGFKYFDIDNIYTEGAMTNTYLLTYRLNSSTLKMNDASAFLSYGEEIYVSEESIYTTRTYKEKRGEENKTVTDILRIWYTGDSFVNKGSVKVDGYIKDRYSLSEYNGFLRVVTTDTSSKHFEDANYTMYPTSASLFIIEVYSMTLVNSKLCFAPEWETVRSVKFKNQYLYVCTSKQTTDPVFFFDLSNPLGELKSKDTGDIPGFSTSLIDFGEDLLGVGIDSNWNFKLEAYKETETGVESVDYYIVNGSYADDYKAYYINREMGLFGLGVYDRNSSTPKRYLLLHYDGTEFEEVLNIEASGTLALMRGVWINDYFYIVSNSDFIVKRVPYPTFGL
ncbi:MAG: beta-propeller domain-containing protein [Clostridia bacterium]|nr:beta-propeller domain-containing protein [Clostridia bacterium]